MGTTKRNDWRLRALRAESELARMSEPHKGWQLEEMRQQADGGGLAAKQAYINALECFYRQAMAENERIQKEIRFVINHGSMHRISTRHLFKRLKGCLDHYP